MEEGVVVMKAFLVYQEPVVALELTIEEYKILSEALNEKGVAGRLFSTVAMNLWNDLLIFDEEVDA